MSDSTVLSVDAETWQTIVARKQKSCLDKIPKEWILSASIMNELRLPLETNANRLIDMDIPKRCGVLSDREVEITEDYDVRSLLDALASSQLTAQEVTLAFCKRAAIAQQLTNCLTETFFAEALTRARLLDEIKSQGKLAGPLHGLPISIKDSMHVKGSESTIGFVSFLGQMAESNAALVDILLELGAVVYVKTNVPQTMMTGDSQNNIYGRTLNPHKTTLTAGGSSGGEGALVAFRGSPLGIGTDVAGSIRIPAFCDGTYGFKPTSSRIPYSGQANLSAPGNDFFRACAGPLANDFDALEILMKAVLDAEPARFDSGVIDVPWRDVNDKQKTKLRLGLMLEDPQFPLHPPVKRALTEAVRSLVAAGHEVIELPIEECRLYECLKVAFAILQLKPGPEEAINASGEPVVASVLLGRSTVKELFKPYPPEVDSLTGIPKLAVLRVMRRELNEAWRQIWNKYHFDAIICPPAQSTATPHDKFLLPPYTTFLNTLDYPACIIPFMKSSKVLDPTPLYMADGQYGPAYEPDVMDGAPCAVQIFTRSMRDEECLQVAKVVNRCLYPPTA